MTGHPVTSAHAVIATQHGTDAQAVTPVDASTFFKDPNHGDMLTYSAVSLPKGLSIDPVTGKIAGMLDRHASVGGPFEVKVTATDSHGGSATARFTWDITNPVPVAVGETARTTAGVALNGTVAGNDFDPDADGIHYKLQSGPRHGLVTLNADGSYRYEAASQYAGSDSFTYAVIDADGGVSLASCTITVEPALNLFQIGTAGLGGGSGAAAGEHGQRGHDPELTKPGTLNEYIHPVASDDGADSTPSGTAEHIRLVVEGSQHIIDRQYGAGAAGAPLRSVLGVGRDGNSPGATVLEPFADAPFWHGLKVIDFSHVPSAGADLGKPLQVAPVTFAGVDFDRLIDAPAVTFSDQIARVLGQFDRDALRLMADLEDAA